MKNEIGIAILDVYTQEDLDLCYKSIPEGYNVLIVSDTKNKLPDCEHKRYGNGVQFATLRNWAISQFRLKGLKHFFLINSNQIIKNTDIFENTIKIAEVFGTWAIMGTENSILSIEDDTNNLTLKLSDKANSNFMYIFSGIISNIGYFDERFFNTKELDITDFIIRMREKKLYPPTGYNPIIDNDVETTRSKIQKLNYKEIDNADKSVQMSYAYFVYKNKYVPTQNDPKSVSKDELMASLMEIQTNYGKK
jgi:hypothetical protein